MRRSGFLFFRKPTTSVIMSHFDSVLIISLCSVISYCPAPPPLLLQWLVASLVWGLVLFLLFNVHPFLFPFSCFLSPSFYDSEEFPGFYFFYKSFLIPFLFSDMLFLLLFSMI